MAADPPYAADYSWVCWEVPSTSRYSNQEIVIDGKRAKLHVALFASHPNFREKGMTSSHSCHNRACVKPSHLVYLPDFVNKGCSGCAGGGWCNHYTTCIRPGNHSCSAKNDSDIFERVASRERREHAEDGLSSETED